ncbi:MAG: hypothetical protein CM1200mP14_17700 [Gammaproteobacteria bacterium]|nr:MAG: hypothetical protein CM1200mP14_17700 [Gammaproteobacteria bacterium]
MGACDDILTVSDPQAYTSSDLDFALPAIANGVEGTVHEVMDNFVVYQSLLGDVYQHTGTWSGYDETDHGRFPVWDECDGRNPQFVGSGRGGLRMMLRIVLHV